MKSITKGPLKQHRDVFRNSMEPKYLGYSFSSAKITTYCLWIWFAGCGFSRQNINSVVSERISCEQYNIFVYICRDLP